MKKTRLFALLLTVCLLAATTPAALAAGNSGAFVVSDANGKTGETVSLTVSVENNPGIIAAALRIDYDSDKLELISVQDENLMNGTATFSQDYTADPYYVSWNDALATENTTANGALVTLTFRVREDCPSGTSEIALTFKPGDVFNMDMEDQPFTAVSGVINIGTADNSGSDITEALPDNGGDSGNTKPEKPGNSDAAEPAPEVQQKPAESQNVSVPVQPAYSNYHNYRDLAENAWYRESVEFMLEKGLMYGVAENLFNPNGNVSRAQLVTILYRAAGEPAVTGRVGFCDVQAGSWYDKAVSWSSFTGVVKGVGDNRFAPSQDITREQLAVMLYRYSGSHVVSEEHLSAFSDAASVSAYAKAAVNWAVEQGILSGADGKLFPGATATRVQAAAMLTRYLRQSEIIPVPQMPGTIK